MKDKMDSWVEIGIHEKPIHPEHKHIFIFIIFHSHFSLFHPLCKTMLTKWTFMYVWMLENKLIPISSTGAIHPAWAEDHTPTHTLTHRPFPLNSYFQQLSAWWGNQALDPRLKSYQLHLFLSPCYHSFLSSRLSFTNPLSSSLISLTPPEILSLSSLSSHTAHPVLTPS